MNSMESEFLHMKFTSNEQPYIRYWNSMNSNAIELLYKQFTKRIYGSRRQIHKSKETRGRPFPDLYNKAIAFLLAQENTFVPAQPFNLL